MATVITTPAELQNVSADLTADYILGNNINMVGVAFNPLGGWGGAANFTGTFDGKDYTIFNLSVAKNGDDEVGLFGTIEVASISNVILNNPSIHGDDYTGGLVGLILGDAIIANCHIVGGSVIGEDNVGGLFGYISGAATPDIDNCDSTCTATSDIGAAGNNNNVGGFVGYMSGTGTIDNCFAAGAVTGVGENVGGFIGYWSSGTFNKCYATGVAVTGNNGGDSYCGGFAGWSNGEATDCYATGAVTATGDYVGGFAGVAGTETNCYSTGSVNGVGANVGGFCGIDDTETNCFWDTETSGQAADPSPGTTGKTTLEMKSVKTFQTAGWAISRIWSVIRACNNGYPCLIGVNSCCASSPQGPVDQTIIGNKVSLEAIRNLEIVYGGRAYVSKSGNFVYESRYHRNV